MWEVELEEVNNSLELSFVKEEVEWLDESSECDADVHPVPTGLRAGDGIKHEHENAMNEPLVHTSERQLHPYMEVSVKIEQGAQQVHGEECCETESFTLSGDVNCPGSVHDNLKTRFHSKELLAFRNCFVRLERMHLYTSQFTCVFCKIKFNSKNYLTKHMLCHTEDLPWLDNKAIKKLNSKRRVCQTCGKYFNSKNKNSLQNVNDNGGNPCTCKRLRISKYFSVDDIEKPFECDDCGKCFKSKFLLRNHIRIHTGEKPYSCPICNKSFSELVNLTRHGRTHTGERPHRCNICSKHFSHKTNLLAHVRIHMQDRPFICKICSKDFVHSSDLKRHEGVHLVDKPFPCHICDKQFARKHRLVDHLKTHIAKVKKHEENN